jgi:hypothetical protein
MAKSTQVEEVVNVGTTLGLPAENYQWETVHTESPDQVTFDDIGDTFIGEYLGFEVIHFVDRDDLDKEFTQLKWRVGDQHYVMNAGYDLLKAFGINDAGEPAIPLKSICRVQLRTLVDVGQQSPMKSYRVDVARASNTEG